MREKKKNSKGEGGLACLSGCRGGWFGFVRERRGGDTVWGPLRFDGSRILPKENKMWGLSGGRFRGRLRGKKRKKKFKR